ncbi:uncharacterized protein LOC144128454 [Amblyomma americanum]
MSDDPQRQELILRCYLSNLHTEGGYWYGYLKCENDLLRFERSLAARHEKYSVRTSREFDAAPKARFVSSMIHCGHKIGLDLQFRVTKETVKVCMFKLNVKGTKKKGCHATLSLKRIELFPDFEWGYGPTFVRATTTTATLYILEGQQELIQQVRRAAKASRILK